LLLRALAGRPFDANYFKVTGQVTINHGKYYRTAAWHRKVGFVQRSDELYSKLTVKENVYFAGKLKCNAADSAISGLLETWRIVQLSEVKAGEIDSEILSVGNRKRVSCAMQTVHNPDVLFLDEPTVGLDPKQAENFLKDLHKFAQTSQVIVIVSINPCRASVFGSFDAIVLLCHGQTVFYGTVDDALRHFQDCLGFPYVEHQNPSDYLIDVVSLNPQATCYAGLDQLRDRLVEFWRECHHFHSSSYEQYDYVIRSSTSGRWPNSWLIELQWLLKRQWRLYRRDPLPIVVIVVQRILIFTLLAFIYFQIDNYPPISSVRIRLSLFLFITANQASLILAVTVPSLSAIRSVLEKERLSLTFRASTFFFARILTDLPISIVISTATSLIVYYITGLRQDCFIRFFIFWAITQLEIYAVTGVGMFVSCLSKSRVIREFLTILIFLSMFMFGGSQVQNRLDVNWTLRWIQFLSPVYYAYVASLQNELTGNVIGELVSGDVLIVEYGLILIGIWPAMAALFGIGCGFFFLAYLSLRITTTPHRVLF